MDQLLVILNEFLSSLYNAHNLIQLGGLLLLLITIYLETGFFIGLILPGGDYLLFTAGLLCGTEYLEISLAGLIASLTAAAILGDFTGFVKGSWLGPKLFKKEKSLIFKPSYLQKARRFYDKYGAIAFITGRFMPVIRPMIPMLAGSSGYPVKRYSFMNISGAILWVGILVPIGFFVGRLYPEILKYKFFIPLVFILMASIPALTIILRKERKS